MGLRSGVCAGRSSSSTKTQENNVFTDVALCSGIDILKLTGKTFPVTVATEDTKTMLHILQIVFIKAHSDIF